MTYYIGYTPKWEKDSRGVVMFDIEYYKNRLGDGHNWHSDIRCCPCVKGLGAFLRDRLQDYDFNYDEFIKDATDIEEVRGLLWERYDNRPKNSKESDEFHYHTFGDVLDKLLNDFAQKYGLWVNRD